MMKGCDLWCCSGEVVRRLGHPNSDEAGRGMLVEKSKSHCLHGGTWDGIARLWGTQGADRETILVRQQKGGENLLGWGSQTPRARGGGFRDGVQHVREQADSLCRKHGVGH